jgi:hypothetical protein
MDYSSIADQPVGKSFDDILSNDNKGNFLVEYGPTCFNICVPKITDSSLNQNELGCLKECFVKSFYSATHTNI